MVWHKWTDVVDNRKRMLEVGQTCTDFAGCRRRTAEDSTTGSCRIVRFVAYCTCKGDQRSTFVWYHRFFQIIPEPIQQVRIEDQNKSQLHKQKRSRVWVSLHLNRTGSNKFEPKTNPACVTSDLKQTSSSDIKREPDPVRISMEKFLQKTLMDLKWDQAALTGTDPEPYWYEKDGTETHTGLI